MKNAKNQFDVAPYILAVSSVGARFTQWREGEIDVFYPFNPGVDGINHRPRGGMHPCFPNFGAVGDTFCLPQHGNLRNTQGDMSSGDGFFSIFFTGHELLGDTGKLCSLQVMVNRRQRGFTYNLLAGIPEEGEFEFPVSAGLHPYFSTPRGIASVHVDGCVENVTGENHYSVIAMTRDYVDVKIPGVGIVRMTMTGDFMTYTSARIVVWRDSNEYLCVEPVLALPEDFGSLLCPKLSHGEPMQFGCKFELLSAHVEQDDAEID